MQFYFNFHVTFSLVKPIIFSNMLVMNYSLWKMSIFMIHQIFKHNFIFLFCFCLWKHLNLWPQVYFTKLCMEGFCVCLSLHLLLLLIYLLYNLYIVMKLLVLCHAQLLANLWIVAHQAPLSMEFSRQKY